MLLVTPAMSHRSLVWRCCKCNWLQVTIALLCLLDNMVWSRIEKINYRQKEKQVLDMILGKGYDKRIRPSGNNNTAPTSEYDDDDELLLDGPTTITVNAMIRSISKIDDYKMEYSVQVTFREQWNDERLRYFDDTQGRLKYLTLTDPTKVWMPDTFFRNEKEARKHEIIVPNVYVRIFPNGEILYSIRISLTLACPMDLRLYPLDKQVCVLQIASYGWAKDDLIYQWKEKDPVQIVPGLHLPRFTLEQYKSAYCDVITNTGEYSCLKVELIFKREFSYYLITIYVPCCMLVIVSWVSFWLDQNAIPARVSLGVTTLLTMSTQTSGINAQLPPVSYTKAIDVWTGVCQCFVFCALLEFALVNYASRSDMQRDRARERMERARRQWELEHADTEQQQQQRGPLFADNAIPGHGPPPSQQQQPNTPATPSTKKSPASAASTLSGSNGLQMVNHIGSSSGDILQMLDGGIPAFALKQRSSGGYQQALREMNEPYRSTTEYPHQLSSSTAEDLAFSSMAYMLPPPPEMMMQQQQHQQQRLCGMHHFQGRRRGGPCGRPAGLCCGGINLIGHTCTYILCCGTKGLLSKFPSRAKRIDVISRFVFPLIFAIFNLAYWLYYLFAKSRSPQLEQDN